MVPKSISSKGYGVRQRVLGMLALASIVAYLDRVAISTTAPAMMQELGITPIEMGMVFSAFVLGYVLFEVPGGWMADRIGARSILGRIIVWWSFFTAATGYAWNFVSLVVIRFLFGVGEAGFFPSGSSVIARWFPKRERGRAQGTILMGSRLGGAFAPALVVALMAWGGWRQVFLIFAVLGVLWAVVWVWWYRNTPAEHVAVSPKELAEIREDYSLEDKGANRVNWWALSRNGNVWALSVMYIGYTYGMYFYVTWLPTYLLEARGVGMAAVGLWAGLPLFLGAISVVVGGFLSDVLVRRVGLRWGRRLPGGLGLLLAGLLLLLSVLLENNVAALIAMVASFACADLLLGPAWATCVDIGEKNAGTVSGCMNSIGHIGGVLSPVVLGWSLQTWGSWTYPLLLTAGFYFLGACLWLVIDPEKTIALPVSVEAELGLAGKGTELPDRAD